MFGFINARFILLAWLAPLTEAHASYFITISAPVRWVAVCGAPYAGLPSAGAPMVPRGAESSGPVGETVSHSRQCTGGGSGASEELPSPLVEATGSAVKVEANWICERVQLSKAPAIGPPIFMVAPMRPGLSLLTSPSVACLYHLYSTCSSHRAAAQVARSAYGSRKRSSGLLGLAAELGSRSRPKPDTRYRPAGPAAQTVGALCEAWCRTFLSSCPWPRALETPVPLPSSPPDLMKAVQIEKAFSGPSAASASSDMSHGT